MTHTELVNQILIEITAMPGVMAWKNSTGVGVTQARTVVRFGLKGSADILGVFRGRALAIEAKTGKGRQHGKQPEFQAKFQECGGLYILARSVADAVDKLT